LDQPQDEAVEFIEPAQEEIEQRLEFENLYYKCMAKAKSLLQTEAVDVPAAENINNNFTKVKLPTLALPTFQGEYEKWMLFKDSFTSVIDQNVSLTPIQKFQYLRSALKGDALQVIECLNTSAENYYIAWDLIKRRYDNRRLIVNTHVQQLLSLPAISKAENITHRSLVDLVRSHVRPLNALDQPVQYWDTIISYIVTSKLDFATRRDWENEVSKIEHDELPSLEDLMKFLENRSPSFELIEKCKIKQELVKGAKVSKKERAVSLVTTERACELCNENHKIYQCQSFLDMPIVTRVKEI